MPEPVNPEDSTVFVDDGWGLPLDVVNTANGNNDGIEMYGGLAFKLALTEAIHQTFERDAAVIEDGTYAKGARGRDKDPDTEIDRLARLIVDGEYRRRAEQEASQ